MIQRRSSNPACRRSAVHTTAHAPPTRACIVPSLRFRILDSLAPCVALNVTLLKRSIATVATVANAAPLERHFPLHSTAKHALHATPGIAPGDGDADRHRYQRRDSHVVHPPSFWSPPEPPPPSHEKLKKLLAKSPRPLPPAWLRIATTNCKAGARQKEARQKKNRRPTRHQMRREDGRRCVAGDIAA